MKMNIKNWINSHPKLKQWLWFVGLWIFGLSTTVVLTYPIKLLIKLAS